MSNNNQIVYDVAIYKTDIDTVETQKNEVFNNAKDAIRYAIKKIIHDCINNIQSPSLFTSYRVWINGLCFTKNGLDTPSDVLFFDTVIFRFNFDRDDFFKPFKLEIREQYKDIKKFNTLLNKIDVINNKSKLDITYL